MVWGACSAGCVWTGTSLGWWTPTQASRPTCRAVPKATHLQSLSGSGTGRLCPPEGRFSALSHPSFQRQREGRAGGRCCGRPLGLSEVQSVGRGRDGASALLQEPSLKSHGERDFSRCTFTPGIAHRSFTPLSFQAALPGFGPTQQYCKTEHWCRYQRTWSILPGSSFAVFIFWGVKPDIAQVLLLVLCLGIISGGAWRTLWGARDPIQALHAGVSLQFYSQAFLSMWRCQQLRPKAQSTPWSPTPPNSPWGEETLHPCTSPWDEAQCVCLIRRHRPQPDGSLIINDVRPEDGGFYACVASAGHDRDQRWVQLRVLGEASVLAGRMGVQGSGVGAQQLTVPSPGLRGADNLRAAPCCDGARGGHGQAAVHGSRRQR